MRKDLYAFVKSWSLVHTLDPCVTTHEKQVLQLQSEAKGGQPMPAPRRLPNQMSGACIAACQGSNKACT